MLISHRAVIHLVKLVSALPEWGPYTLNITLGKWNALLGLLTECFRTVLSCFVFFCLFFLTKVTSCYLHYFIFILHCYLSYSTEGCAVIVTSLHYLFSSKAKKFYIWHDPNDTMKTSVCQCFFKKKVVANIRKDLSHCIIGNMTIKCVK